MLEKKIVLIFRLGGWTFGHINKHGHNDSELASIKRGFKKVWDIFNESSEILKFDWQDVLNNASLVTENDTFLPNDPTIFDSFDKMFEYMDIEEGVKVCYFNGMWKNLKYQFSYKIPSSGLVQQQKLGFLTCQYQPILQRSPTL